MTDQSLACRPSADHLKLAALRLKETLQRSGGTFEINDRLCEETVELIVTSGNYKKPPAQCSRVAASPLQLLAQTSLGTLERR